MTDQKSSLQAYLIREINDVLQRPMDIRPLLLWCDPHKEWQELLKLTAAKAAFDLWADDCNELVLRDRFAVEPRVPRVVWLPCSRSDIRWFKVFELEADAIWEKSLIEALREYGVDIPRENERDLLPVLAAHAKEWLDKPKETWKELTPGTAKGTLVDDQRMLEVLSGETGEFERLMQDNRFEIFARRAREDFGFADPTGRSEESWRVAATAQLLCTEAAEGCPQEPPSEAESIIPTGLCRDNALKLLRSWQAHIHHIEAFERIAIRADGTVGLSYWARNLVTQPRSLSSRAVEKVLFDKSAAELDQIDEVEVLTKTLAERLQDYKYRQQGFWETLATKKIGWGYLVRLGDAANVLLETKDLEKSWKSPGEAVDWYQSRGWQLDQVGETLFEESPDMPPQLQRVRDRLRRGYFRAIDRIGRVFSELISKDFSEIVHLPSVGEVVLEELERSKAPTALVYLDACRLEIGKRLAEILNSGEPVQRAKVLIAAAPTPTITELGMAFALPLRRDSLQVSLTPDGKRFRVSAEGFGGDLAVAEDRRKLLSAKIGAKECLSVADVLEGGKLKSVGKSRKPVVVLGTELDTEGHEGQLMLKGADEHLERYAKAVRALRDAGYRRVIIATDHGFFHWQPAKDERDDEKPSGELLWQSRRAMVGHDLSHMSAIGLPVTQSDLVAMVPRSVNAFKTYGGLGYFHGGATLQESIVPVIVAEWPAKASKITVVLKPIEFITSLNPRVQIESAYSEQGRLFGVDSALLVRRVFVRVRDPKSGKVVFKHPQPVTVEPGGESSTIQLDKADSAPLLKYGDRLDIEVIDADDDDLLTREKITLKVDIDDEWGY